MAHVVIEGGLVVGIFAEPQPHLENYEEISDSDPRITDFYQQQTQ